MVVLNNTGILAGASGAVGGGGDPEKRSTRFNDDDTATLTRTPSNIGNRKTFTWSMWCKRSTLGSTLSLFGVNSGSASGTYLSFNNDALRFRDANGGTTFIETNALYRDCSAFYHIVLAVDTTQATDTNKIKLYVNNSQVESFSSTSYPAQYTELDFNTTNGHMIGGLWDTGYTGNTFGPFDGLISDIHFVDGQQLTPGDFAEEDATTGQWVPKEYTGDYNVAAASGNLLTYDNNAALPVYLNQGGGGTPGGTNKPVSNAFDSDPATYCDMSYNNTQWSKLTFDQPITNVTDITLGYDGEGHAGYNSGNETTGISFNGSRQTVQIYNGTAIPLTDLYFVSQAGNGVCRLYDVTITTSSGTAELGCINATGQNSFHLAMDPAETGTNYSSTLTSGSGAWFVSGGGTTFAPTFAFNGTTAGTYAEATSNTITWAPTNLSWSSSLEVMCASTNITAAIDNGTGVPLTAGQWTEVSSGAGSINTSLILTHTGTTANLKGIRVDGKILVDHTAIGHDSSGEENHWHENNLFANDGGAPSKTLTRLRTKTDWNTHRISQIKINDTELTTGTLDNTGSVWTDTGEWKDGNADSSNATYSTAARGDWFDVTLASNITNFSKLEIFMQLDSAAGSTTNIYEIELFFSDGSSFLKTYAANSDAPNQSAGAFNSWQWQNFGNFGNPADIDLLSDVPGAPYDNGLNGGGNYATLNPLNLHSTSNDSTSNGNLEASGTNGSANLIPSTIAFSSGKYYYEVEWSDATAPLIGIRRSDSRNYDNMYAYHGDGNKYTNGGSATSYGATFSTGDVIGCAVDMDAGTIKFYKNDADQGQAFSGISGEYTFCQGVFGGTTSTYTVNFGQRTFDNLPTGYKALNTYNLDPPLIDDPSEHFDVATDTGAGILDTAKDLTDGADFVWIKDRDNNSAHHSLFNRINDPDMDGSTHMRSNENHTEATCGAYSAPSGNSVGWVWNAGDAANPTSVSVGDYNSSTYNQDETWSTHLTFSNDGGGYLSNRSPADQCFDGTRDENAATDTVGTSAYIEVSGLNLTTSNTLEITLQTGSPGSLSWSVTGTDLTTTAIATNAQQFVNIPITGNNVTGFKVTSTDSGARAHLTAIRINGKELVDSGVTINSPSIASEYKANTAAGFSIISYTGAGNNGDSIGHGLNSKPAFAIFKIRNTAWSWNVYHQDIGDTHTLYLNTDAQQDAKSNWADMSSSTITFTNSLSNTNDSGDPFICLAWSEVEGYSKFGSYEGGNSAFIWCGFKPKYLLIKCSSTAGQEWVILDSARSPTNVVDNELNAENSNDESADSTRDVDFLSNGFKLRNTGSGSTDYTGSTYMFCAFAETPFKYSNAQ